MSEKSKRPNFVLFITDQHRADYLGCYGHPVLRTPNIDGIAEKGLRFEQFYVASPVCMPNRASLMTGRLPSVHGVRLNGIPLPLESKTFVDKLASKGYRTALVGKSHLQNFTGMSVYGDQAVPDEAVARNLRGEEYLNELPEFWETDDPEIPLPFYGFQHVDLITGHGDHCGGAYGRWLRERLPNADELIGAKHQLPHNYSCPQAVRTALPEELYSTSYIAEKAIEYLQNVSDEPFFLMVSFPDPHHPFNPPGRYWDAYRPEDMQVPEAFRRPDWTPPPHVQAAYEERETGVAVIQGMNTISCTEQEALEARALTCGMIEMIDDAVGRVLGALNVSGKSNETVTIFTSDHGDHLGDHKLLLKGSEQYSDITRVPFIWADPEEAKRGATDQLGQTHDISSTILARAGLSSYVGTQGRDLFGENERDALLIQYEHQKQHLAFGKPPRVHSVVDGDWRLSIFDGADWGELYDLKNDPGEFINLWDAPDAAATKARLMERLARLEIEAVDHIPRPTMRA